MLHNYHVFLILPHKFCVCNIQTRERREREQKKATINPGQCFQFTHSAHTDPTVSAASCQ